MQRENTAQAELVLSGKAMKCQVQDQDKGLEGVLESARRRAVEVVARQTCVARLGVLGELCIRLQELMARPSPDAKGVDEVVLRQERRLAFAKSREPGLARNYETVKELITRYTSGYFVDGPNDDNQLIQPLEQTEQETVSTAKSGGGEPQMINRGAIEDGEGDGGMQNTDSGTGYQTMEQAQREIEELDLELWDKREMAKDARELFQDQPQRGLSRAEIGLIQALGQMDIEALGIFVEALQSE